MAFCDFFGIKQDQFDLQEYVKFIVSRSSSQGWFSCKMHINHWLYWSERGVDLMDMQWNHVFYLKRKNKIKQAVSLARARKTNAWRAYDSPMAEDTSTFTDILESLSWLYEHEKIYENHLQSYCSRSFVYEDFAFENSQDIFKEFSRIVGTTCKPNPLNNTKRQESINPKNCKVNHFIDWLSQ
ncbi:hypothetical protein OA238_118p0170 (plasmid) [Octadecabacter arcticus 238]|uniref:Uncharacterized protein n=2 Tax=Octadecabacter arcticus TaxID=53946 RepID=M9RW25_9RHOB|nr:hypothetical protein OA238_118p0170 [Octadecabacter arcticus 238]